MISILSLLLIRTLSLVVTRVAAIALTITGLSSELDQRIKGLHGEIAHREAVEEIKTQPEI
ncbi:MAG: hypothetical protein U9Q77_04140 [Candidatus Marinimicrobia bacterium]|nr:hypothetical protein [Candidatus Neomarinimicrobiota bacterium]